MQGHNESDTIFTMSLCLSWASLVVQMAKHLPAVQETRVQSLGWEDPLEKGMATHSCTLAWKIPGTEEPGRLQTMGLQTVGHDWATSLSADGGGEPHPCGLSWGCSPGDARHFLSHSVLMTGLLGPTQTVQGWEMTTLASSHGSCLLALWWTIWYLCSKFSSLRFCSVAKSCPNLCDPIAAHQASLSSLPPRVCSTHIHWIDDVIQTSHPLPPPSPALNLFHHQGLFQCVGSSSGGQSIVATASVLPMNI